MMRGIIDLINWKRFAIVLLGLVVVLLLLKLCDDNIRISQNEKKTELDSIKFQKKQLPKLQEKEQELKAEIKVLTPKREKEIRKYETLKQDSVPCPQIVNQCDTVIKYDNQLIVALNNVIQIDSSIISIQDRIISNQDVLIEELQKENAGLKTAISDTCKYYRRKGIGKFFKGFSVGFATGVTTGQLTK